MKQVLLWLAYALLFCIALAFYVNHAERTAAGKAARLCAAMPAGMTVDAANRLMDASGADRLVRTATGRVALFSGALGYSRYTCEAELGTRVMATRLGHLD